MSQEKAGAGAKVGAGMGMGSPQVVVQPAPFYAIQAECVGPEGVRWRDGFEHNAVMTAGLTYAANKIFGNQTASSYGPYLALHSATSHTSHVWNQISASTVGGYAASVPQVTFATNAFSTALSASVSYAYSFTTQGPYTVSGAAILWHSSNALASNAASGGIVLYAQGQFANSRQVLSNDTLNVTATVSLGTA